MQHSREKATNGLGLALVLAIAFLGLSYLRTWGDLNSALFGGRVIESTLSQPIWGTRLGFRLAGFMAAQLLLHLSVGLLSWLLAHASLRIWPDSRNGLRAWTLCWFTLVAAWVLIANAAWFPNSSLGERYADAVRAGPGPLDVFTVATVFLLAAIGYVVGVHAFRLIRGASRQRRSWLLAGALSLALVGPLLTALRAAAPETFDRPHVVLIGIDSLRADYVERQPTLTPAMDEYLSEATVFSDTITPLARTFPAWVSIVSGRHPHSTGAVINLFPRERIDAGETLPTMMAGAGYQTVYSIDEVRFSNLDTSYGFGEMVTPPMGAADFLIGYLHDVPLSNLVVNTPLGRLLFPFSHANRAHAATYDPDSFVDLLSDELRFDRPTLLATHLTLPHWPFTWASAETVAAPTRGAEIRLSYDQSIRRVDEQFRDLMSLLETRGVLDNAIVVLFSDHGESLGEAALDTAGTAQEKGVYGHGTDVLALHQYRVLLSMRGYGAAELGGDARRDIEVPASLEDIAPTLADMLALETRQEFDGLSLAPLLREDEDPAGSAGFEGRVRFLETEFNPPGFAVGIVPQASQIEDAAQSYHVDPSTDRLSMRSEMLERVLSGREYAALHDDAILAVIPVGRHDRQRLIYVEQGSSPLRLDAPPDPHDNPRAHRLWLALKRRFEPVGQRPVVPWGTGA